MRFPLRLLVVGLVCAGTSLSADVWRPPVPAPAACSKPTFEVLLIDVSRSMAHSGVFQHVQRMASDHIRDGVPACTLAVVASFGLTADVQDGAFLNDPESRQRLIRAVLALKPDHRTTNLDEAAKLVELLNYQLRAAYGFAADRLVVRVHSDFESSPSVGKPNFSLGAYLARRMEARYVRIPGEKNTAEEALTLRAKRNAAALGSSSTPAQPKMPSSVLSFAVGGAVILLASLIGVIWLRTRSRNKLRNGGGLRALLVTESAESAVDGTPVVGPERRVDVVLGVPAVFSTDTNAATYIASVVPGAANGELFRVEPLPDGSVRVESPHPRLTVNGEPLDLDRRLRVDIREPIRVGLGPREFAIVGVFGRPRSSDRGDEVFDAEALQH